MKMESCINQMTLSMAKPRSMAVIMRASLTASANVNGCLSFREIYGDQQVTDKQLWSLHTRERPSAVRRREALTLATASTDRKSVV